MKMNMTACAVLILAVSAYAGTNNLEKSLPFFDNGVVDITKQVAALVCEGITVGIPRTGTLMR